MGNHPIPGPAVKRLACETQGFFTSVNTMSAVRPRMIVSFRFYFAQR
jgi:hypothetical protein